MTYLKKNARQAWRRALTYIASVSLLLSYNLPAQTALLSSPAAILIPTDESGALSGRATAVGDLNCDGLDDVIVGTSFIGALWWGVGTPAPGRVHVYRGSATEPTGLAPDSPKTLIPTTQLDTQVGGAGMAVGDFDGDNCGDLVIGANLFDNVVAEEGRVFVYYGFPLFFDSSFAPTLQEIANPSPTADYFGGSVSAGDVNGDGFADLAISAPGYDGEAANEGRAYIFHGSSSGLSSSPALSLDPTNQEFAMFGNGLLADVNGDGFSDAVISSEFYDAEAADEGRVYVYHGSSSGLSSSPALTLDPTDQTAAFFGFRFTGDFNGDGFADVVISAYSYDADAVNEGRAFIYHGSSLGLLSTPALVLDPTDQAGAQFGFGASADFNGDGYSDVMITAPTFDTTFVNEGRGYVYYGSVSGLSSVPALTVDPTNQDQGWFFMGSAGDVNGDLFGDVVMGAQWLNTATATGAGAAYVYLGAMDDSDGDGISDQAEQALVGSATGLSVTAPGITGLRTKILPGGAIQISGTTSAAGDQTLVILPAGTTVPGGTLIINSTVVAGQHRLTITGQILPAGTTKTMFVDSGTSVCIVDSADTSRITEDQLTGCSTNPDLRRINILCNGTSVTTSWGATYTCTPDTDLIRIDGLQFSTVMTFEDADNDDVEDSSDDCPGLAGAIEFAGCPAALDVQFDRHTVQSGTQPGSTKVGIAGAAVNVFSKTAGSCAAGIGISPKNWNTILSQCAPEKARVTDSSGHVLIGMAPGDYLLLGRDPATNVLAGVAASDLTAGQLMQKYLQVIVRADGSSVPAKTTIKTGSELRIIEPEYVEWNAAQELYPFVFESVGDWGVTVTMSPPEGFVADYSSLAALVNNEYKALQFTLTDLGSCWECGTDITFEVRHKGKKEVLHHKIGTMLDEDFAREKGMDLGELRRKGLVK